MTEKPRFWRRTVFAKNLGFGVGFEYRNNTTRECGMYAGIPTVSCIHNCWVFVKLSHNVASYLS